MTVIDLGLRWDAARRGFFAWRDSLSVAEKLALCLVMAGLTGLAAQVRIVLPFTGVPITGQVFAVLLSGILLGGAFGGASQALYLGLGLAGVPWFSGWRGGLALGVTAGYIIGFIPAAALVGRLTGLHARARCMAGLAAIMTLGAAVIYVFGAAYYARVTGCGLALTMAQAVLPFLPGEIVKVLAAACVARAVLPREAPPD